MDGRRVDVTEGEAHVYIRMGRRKTKQGIPVEKGCPVRGYAAGLWDAGQFMAAD